MAPRGAIPWEKKKEKRDRWAKGKKKNASNFFFFWKKKGVTREGKFHKEFEVIMAVSFACWNLFYDLVFLRLRVSSNLVTRFAFIHRTRRIYKPIRSFYQIIQSEDKNLLGHKDQTTIATLNHLSRDAQLAEVRASKASKASELAGARVSKRRAKEFRWVTNRSTV